MKPKETPDKQAKQSTLLVECPLRATHGCGAVPGSVVMAWEPDVQSDCCVLAGSLSDPKKQIGNHTGAEFKQGVGREMLIN